MARKGIVQCAADFCSLLLLLLAYFSASFERCSLGRKSKKFTFASRDFWESPRIVVVIALVSINIVVLSDLGAAEKKKPATLLIIGKGN
jgi:hypothetical protein